MNLNLSTIVNNYVLVVPVKPEELEVNPTNLLLPATNKPQARKQHEVGLVVDYDAFDADLDKWLNNDDVDKYVLYETAGAIEVDIQGEKLIFVKKNYVVAFFGGEQE